MQQMTKANLEAAFDAVVKIQEETFQQTMFKRKIS